MAIFTCVALTHRVYGTGGERNPEGIAARDTARRKWLHQSCKQGGAALLIPSIFVTESLVPCSHPDNSAVATLLTLFLVPQMPLGEGAGPCHAWSMVKKAWNWQCPCAMSRELERHSATNSTVVVSGGAIPSFIKRWVFTHIS